MLSGTLVRVRFSKQRVIPLYLNRDDPQWLEVAESLLLIFREAVGRTRGEIEAEIDELVGEGLATLAHRGLAKILEDRAEFEVVADVPPETIREKVFTAAAEHRKALRASGQAQGHVPPRGRPRRGVPPTSNLKPRAGRRRHSSPTSAMRTDSSPSTRGWTPRRLIDRYNVALGASPSSSDR